MALDRNFVDGRGRDLPRELLQGFLGANGGVAIPFEGERVGIVKRARFPCPISEIRFLFGEKK